jgi:hypothetical protein
VSIDLPEWPAGTVALLATQGERPYAVPVSTALRAGPRQIVLALAHTRGSLARLHANPHVAVTLLCEGDVALTAHGRARVIAPELDGAPGVAGVLVEVDELHDHGRPAFEIEAGVRWRWVDDEAGARDQAVRGALERLRLSLDPG